MPQTGPGLWKTRRPRPRTEWAARKHFPFANRGAAVIRAHRTQLRKEQKRNGHGCQRPSCGHGSGPTGNCMPEMPDCDQPRRAFPLALFCVTVGVLDAAFSSGGCVHFRLSVYTCRSNRVCAHAEARPALTQVVSKKAKAALSITRQRFQRLSRGRQLRNGEDAANLHTLFPLRLATNCADHALHDLPQQSDC